MGPSDYADFSIEALKKAAETLGEALVPPPRNTRERDGAIQRFEYTFELSWKTLKKYFEINNNLSEHNVKNIFREAAKQGLVEDVDQWFSFLRARNKTSHNYHSATADEVFEKTLEFYSEVKKLIQKLEKLL